MIPICTVIVIGVFSLIGCGGDMLTAPGAENENQTIVAEQIGIPTDQLNLVPLRPEIAEQLRVLGKKSFSQKQIQAHRGGTVGGEKTFGNKVNIPAGALDEDTWISVEVECFDSNRQCGSIVEFLPSMSFLVDVTITLSFDILDFDGDPDLLRVIWYDDSTGLWVEVDNVIINYEDKTVSILVSHFTRYAWAL